MLARARSTQRRIRFQLRDNKTMHFKTAPIAWKVFVVDLFHVSHFRINGRTLIDQQGNQ